MLSIVHMLLINFTSQLLVSVNWSVHSSKFELTHIKWFFRKLSKLLLFIFLANSIVFFIENQSWHSMWNICQLMFNMKCQDLFSIYIYIKPEISSAAVVIGILRAKWNHRSCKFCYSYHQKNCHCGDRNIDIHGFRWKLWYSTFQQNFMTFSCFPEKITVEGTH